MKLAALGCLGVLIFLLVVAGFFAMPHLYFGPKYPEIDPASEFYDFALELNGLTEGDSFDNAAAYYRLQETYEELAERTELLVTISGVRYLPWVVSEGDAADLSTELREDIDAAVLDGDYADIDAAIDELITRPLVLPRERGEIFELGFIDPRSSVLERGVFRLLQKRAKLAIARNDVQTAVDLIIKLRRYLLSTAAEPATFFFQSNANERFHTDSLAVALVLSRKPDLDMLEQLAITWQADSPLSVRDVLRGERWVAHELLGDLNGKSILKRDNADAIRHRVDEYYEEFDAYVALSRQGQRGSEEPDVDPDEWGEVFYKVFLPLDKILNREALLETKSRVARTVIAIERHRLTTGSLPTTLDELVPKYLDAVPRDIDADRPLTYRLDDASKHGYILYAVGRDGEDNGGKLEPDMRSIDPIVRHGSAFGYDAVFVGPGVP
ncbi:MAG: hypothetical protein AAF747_00625 [Planctomycetota bacterium]